MSFLVFDVETTGKMLKHLPQDHPDQPKVVQLAAELCSMDGRPLSSVSIIVNPGVPIPDEAAGIHGITTKMAEEFGVPTIVAVAMFNNMAKLAKALVAHNASYDVWVLTKEYLHLGRPPIFYDRPVHCTMLLSTNECKLRGKYKDYKWPSLKEAYEILVDPAGFEGAHDALADVRACRKVYMELSNRGRVS